MKQTESKTAHTPTPWKIEQYGASNNDAFFDIAGKRGHQVATQVNESNAQFIVTACNSHDELVRACLTAYEFLEKPQANRAILMIESALRSAGAQV